VGLFYVDETYIRTVYYAPQHHHHHQISEFSQSSNACIVLDDVTVEQLLDQLLHRIPSLANIEPQELRTFTESFTPDGKYIMGPAPEVRTSFYTFHKRKNQYSSLSV